MFAVQPTDGKGQTFNVDLSMNISSDVQHLNRLAITLAIAAVVGTFVISLGGMSIVSYGLAPVRRLAHQLRSLSADNLRPRLDGAGQPAELVPLGGAVQRPARPVDSAYTQLEGFNADVSHELRTLWQRSLPAMSLRCVTQRTLIWRKCCPPTLRSSTASLASSTICCFCQRRTEVRLPGAHLFPVLQQLSERVAEYHEAALADADLRLKISGDGTGHFDEPLLRRAVSNLIGNATQYAKPGTQVEVNIAVVSDTEEPGRREPR